MAVVVILGGGFYLYRNYSASPKTQIAPIEGRTVTFSGSSFSPSSLEVKVGDTVTFVNNSSLGMWVASAPHPTHTDYPEFDAKQVYNPGEVYAFTFTKAGNWKFHNHLNPTYFGVIVVK